MKQTLFFVAGCPSADATASRVMRSLRTQFPSKEFRFIGIGGPQMAREGLNSVGPTSDQFNDKPFFPVKNFIQRSTYLLHHPVHAYTRFVNYRVRKQLKLLNIMQEENPDAFVTFENEFFMRAFYMQVREHYNSHNRLCPPTFWYGLTHINQAQKFQKYLDHMFTRIPMTQINNQRFTFPHTQVGWDGVFRAYRYLFNQNEKYKPLTDNPNTLLLPDESFPLHELVSQLVNNERIAFRKSHNINDQDTVLFLAAGNRPHEIKNSIPVVNQGIQQFLQKPELKQVPKESLTLVISVPEFEDYKELTQKAIEKEKWPIRIIQVTDENQKFQAMAASDIGFAMNGHIVAECAAFQLPTTVLDPGPFYRTYFSQLYNSFDLDLNIAAKGHFYPELLLSTIPNRIATVLLELYQDPKLRYYYIDNYRKVLRRSLPKSNEKATEQQEASFPKTKLIAYQSASSAMASTILTGIEKYSSLDKVIKQGTDEERRINAFKELGWAKGL